MLLDDLLPSYHINMVHSTQVRATPGRVMRAVLGNLADCCTICGSVAIHKPVPPGQ